VFAIGAAIGATIVHECRVAHRAYAADRDSVQRKRAEDRQRTEEQQRKREDEQRQRAEEQRKRAEEDRQRQQDRDCGELCTD